MNRHERAKIFIPFDPLKGFQEALRRKEREVEAHAEHGNEGDPTPDMREASLRADGADGVA